MKDETMFKSFILAASLTLGMVAPANALSKDVCYDWIDLVVVVRDAKEAGISLMTTLELTPDRLEHIVISLWGLKDLDYFMDYFYPLCRSEGEV